MGAGSPRPYLLPVGAPAAQPGRRERPPDRRRLSE